MHLDEAFAAKTKFGWMVVSGRVDDGAVYQRGRQLTAGVAHNFNDHLMAVIGNLDFLEEDANISDPCLEQARSAALRAANMVRQFRLFSRSESDYGPRTLQIGQVLGDSIAIARIL